MRELERVPGGEDLILARVTYELLRPVPIARLELEAEVVRPGRRVQLIDAVLRGEDGTEVVRARALRVARAGAGTYDEPAPPPAGPQELPVSDFRPGMVAGFATDAMEIRFAAGRFGVPGPATVWFRLAAEVVAGEPPTPLQSLAAAGDFGNGVGSSVPWEDHLFINPDLTLYLERAPEGEWICLSARMRVSGGGVGLAESELYDRRGRVGRAIQSLLVERR